MWWISKKSGVDSREAIENANRHLKDIQSRSKEVSDLAEAMKEIRRRNHFADSIQRLLANSKGG